MNPDTLNILKKMKVPMSVMDELGEIWKDKHDAASVAMIAYSYGVWNTRQEQKTGRKTRNAKLG